MGATISDVAKKAGVSPATVSKYLNRKAVSAENRERIAQAIHDLNYQVNDFARSLRTNSSKLIGLLVPSIDYKFSFGLFKAVEEQLSVRDYGFILYNYASNAATFTEKISLLRQRMVDGVLVLLSGRINDQINQGLLSLQAANIPYVLINSCVEDARASTVLADNEQTIRNCVSCLLQKGHRKIAMIMAIKASFNSQNRMAGYRKAYADFGLTVDEELLLGCEGENSWLTAGKERIRVFLQAHPEITALVLTGSRMTLIGIGAVLSTGRKIGEDLSVIGYDGDIISDLLPRPITFVRLPVEEVANSAVELLLDAIKGGTTIQTVRIPEQIIEGESVFSI